MPKCSRMRLWTPLLLGLAMAGAGFSVPSFAHGCNGHSGFVGYRPSGCNGFNGFRYTNGFNGHNGDAFVHWHTVREPVVGFRTRAVPHVHRRCNGFNGYSGFTSFDGYNGYYPSNVGFLY